MIVYVNIYAAEGETPLLFETIPHQSTLITRRELQQTLQQWAQNDIVDGKWMAKYATQQKSEFPLAFWFVVKNNQVRITHVD